MTDPGSHLKTEEELDTEDEQLLTEVLSDYLTPQGEVDLQKLIAHAIPLELPEEQDDE